MPWGYVRDCLGAYAFYNCMSLSSVTIPYGITTIPDHAFQGCNNLATLTIPSSVITIGNFSFTGCFKLTSLTFSSNMVWMGDSAFAGCIDLKSAIFMGNSPSMPTSAFDSTNKNFTVYYFSGSFGFPLPPIYWYPSVALNSRSAATIWLITKGLPYNANLTSTPNHDGVPLLMSYALNLDPTQNQSANIPKPVINGTQMSLTYFEGSTGVTYSVEVSNDLQNWNSNGVTTSAPDSNNFCTATVPVSGTNQFMRLKVVY